MAEETLAPTPIAAGEPAPPFTLPGRSGAPVSLADFAGKGHVLVYFYPKDDTPGCTKEACSLRDGFAELREAGVTVLGISPDGADSHNAFAAKYSLPFELLTDADHAVHDAYGVWGKTPWGVGTIRTSFLVGPDGKVLHVFDKVQVDDHARQVLAVLRPTRAEEAKAAVGAAVEAAGAAVGTVVEEAKKAVTGAMKSPEVKQAVAKAKKAVADVKAQPAVKKAVATAEKAVTDAKKAVADVKKKPAVKKAVAEAKKVVAKAKTAAAKKPTGALAKLLALVSPKKAARKPAPARRGAKKPAPKPAKAAKPKAAPKKAVKKAVRKAAPRKPARKTAARR